jgi:hypothetical protein
MVTCIMVYSSGPSTETWGTPNCSGYGLEYTWREAGAIIRGRSGATFPTGLGGRETGRGAVPTESAFPRSEQTTIGARKGHRDAASRARENFYTVSRYTGTLSSEFFSTFHDDTCLLSVSCQYFALDGIRWSYHYYGLISSSYSCNDERHRESH